jgi:hypothetical protein
MITTQEVIRNVTAAANRINELEVALKKYGRHESHCTMGRQIGLATNENYQCSPIYSDCDCGFDKVRRWVMMVPDDLLEIGTIETDKF